MAALVKPLFYRRRVRLSQGVQRGSRGPQICAVVGLTVLRLTASGPDTDKSRVLASRRTRVKFSGSLEHRCRR
eukprot:9035407-Pyramimonas_sp.AAC.1